MAIQFPYAKQSIQPQDIQAVADSLKEEWITRGPPVQRFEQAIANYCQVPHAVAFNNATSALMAAYFAAGFNPNDQVFSTPNSFIATVGPALQKGIRPTFVDIDRSTGNLDLQALSLHLNHFKGSGRPFIVPVHFSGISVDMLDLKKTHSQQKAIIIEDAAHALGSFYPSGEKVGSCAFSDMTIFSFHPAKTLTTGEGGMVTTRNADLFHRLQLFRNNGIERSAPYLVQSEALGYYEVHAITGNYHLTSFQAALGLSQLQRLDQFIEKRRLLVKRYRQHLAEIPYMTLFTDQHDAYTAFHLFVVQIDFKRFKKTREQVMQALLDVGIGTQVHYIPLYRHPVLLEEQEKFIRYPKMETYYQQALSLPLYFDLAESEVDEICQKLFTIFTTNG